MVTRLFPWVKLKCVNLYHEKSSRILLFYKEHILARLFLPFQSSEDHSQQLLVSGSRKLGVGVFFNQSARQKTKQKYSYKQAKENLGGLQI